MPLLGASNNDPMPNFGRMFVFVDGENSVIRFKAILKDGKEKRDEVKYEPDVYVWSAASVQPDLHEVIRATYYTYAVGDSVYIDKMKEQLKSLTFNKNHYSRKPNHLFPRVFKKEKKTAKGKGVDIQMTVD